MRKYKARTGTDQQKRYVEAWKKTRDNVEAYKLAGYDYRKDGKIVSNLSQRAFSVYSSNFVKTELIKYMKKGEIINLARDLNTVEYLRKAYWVIHDAAMKGTFPNLAVAKNALDSIGRTFAAFTDNINTNMEHTVKLAENKILEAKHIASILIEKPLELVGNGQEDDQDDNISENSN